MRYIDLSAITQEHVRGCWEVESRMVNPGSQQNLFADVRIIEIKPDHYRSVNGKERRGLWQVVREEELIYNPQLKFFIEGNEVGNAIITRLRVDEAGQSELYKLTLYFHTGLELTLQKNSPLPI
ncbi:hypothetical protein [Flaviaesturariibacter amylovorans]|uniref:Lipocalin-like domain-containing protein n=1 Tax=Flaviaesturariibacter amylovorans TaxID=1084520 RepID=A0ABP8HPF9_9BACT